MMLRIAGGDKLRAKELERELNVQEWIHLLENLKKDGDNRKLNEIRARRKRR